MGSQKVLYTTSAPSDFLLLGAMYKLTLLLLLLLFTTHPTIFCISLVIGCTVKTGLL